MTSHIFSPLSREFQQDPYAAYHLLREQPAVYIKELNQWWVGRFKDVQAISSQPEVFSNAKFHEIGLGEFDYAPEADSLVACDPPIHTRLRKLATDVFKPSKLRALDGHMRAIVSSHIDRVMARSDKHFDFQHDFSELIPIEVVALFLGTDLAHADDYRRWSSKILSASQRAAMGPEEHEEIRRAIREAREYFLNLIAERRKSPKDDAISAFIAAQNGDDRLTDGEILSLCILLLNGGNETTAHCLGSIMVSLWNNPDQLALLRENPSLIPAVVDETLRFESPVQTAFLWTTRNVSVDGVEIPAESAVIACWGAANRDEQQYTNPDKFDITRKRIGHLAFGYGPHFCLGNMLGKQEMIIALECLLERMPNLRRANDSPTEWIPSYWVRGPRTLPVTY